MSLISRVYPGVSRAVWARRSAFLLLIVLAAGSLPVQAATPAAYQGAYQEETFEITFQSLGYDETILKGPQATARYYFGLPATWVPQQGGYVALDLNYTTTATAADATALLHVRLNDQLLQTKLLEPAASRAGSRDLRLLVYLPPEHLVTSAAQIANTLKLEFEVREVCERALQVTLTVNDSSILHLVYDEQTVVPDLSLYPAPIYEREAFEPAGVEFLLPLQPSAAELEAATMIAARLGALTADGVPISATLSTDSQTLASPNHLIIIGRPDDQPLIPQLALPVPVARRSLALTADLHADVVSGELLTYTVRVTNTSLMTQTLSLHDQAPAGATLVTCTLPCTTTGSGVVVLDLGLVAPGQQVSATLTLSASLSADWMQSGGPTVRTPVANTASLLGDQGQVLNVATTFFPTGTVPGGDYLFVHDGLALPETDGLVQEIVAPSRSDRVAVVVTGLDDAALTRAARSLSSENYAPSMWSTHALVQATAPISGPLPMPAETMAFASLGYPNQTIASIQADRLDYRFEMPAGWRLSNDAYLALHITHGTALNSLTASGEVQINNLPVGSFPLDASNSSSTWLAVPLVSTATRAGTNRISISISADPELVCLYTGTNRYWLTIFADSFLHLPRREADESIGLDNLPYPFAGTPGLQDVAFLLPERPSQMQVAGMLRLASRMGLAAGGSDFSPQVALGGSPETEPWHGYHLIVIGVPTDNAYLAAANDHLPQRFQAGTNEIRQELNRVVYRLAPGESMGSLQELRSPWDATRTMLAVTGTTLEGVGWALDALTADQLTGDLAGNLASVRAGQVWSVDTRGAAPEDLAALLAESGFTPGEKEGTSAAVTATAATTTVTPETSPTVASMPTATPTSTRPAAAPPTSMQPVASATSTPALNTVSVSTPTEPVASAEQPIWLIPLLGLSGVTLIAAAGVAIWQARRR